MASLAVVREPLVGRCRSRLRDAQTTIRERFLAGGDAPRLLCERCQLIDAVLGDLWRELVLPPSLALVAVGGYGRGELYPASDVDLMLLLPGPPDEALTAQLEAVVTVFYDIGLEIAPSVRTIDECSQAASGDLTVQTALLEARLLAGNGRLFEDLSAELTRSLDPHAFFEAKKKEQEER
ncbi:MAG: nucleotidyltransferase domain-containing protein, partial [Candidatus Accumulibacter phosphatis]|uniref:nucleotidyltransferase domain-containing protein n=1 Tax=Candidatus Accumulibacter phosphatis TaxID=327160 RepID=UPI001A4F5692|nr:nucleotidyltransferase domain-containing protein [Candidatus Accumulibacter phosphatis]